MYYLYQRVSFLSLCLIVCFIWSFSFYIFRLFLSFTLSQRYTVTFTFCKVRLIVITAKSTSPTPVTQYLLMFLSPGILNSGISEKRTIMSGHMSCNENSCFNICITNRHRSACRLLTKSAML